MRRTHYYGSWSERDTGTSVAPLPFLEPLGEERPPCVDHAETFTVAADDSRKTAVSRAARRSVRQAERTAKALCTGCPVLDACRAYSLETRQTWGIWGATNPIEREHWHRRQKYLRQRGLLVPGKFDDVPTMEMFPSEELRVAGTSAKKRPHRTVVGRGNCPECSKQPMSLYGSGDHWVWREHTYTTWGGSIMVCRASGVGLCVAPEPDGKPYNATALVCPHETLGGDAA